MEMSGSWRWAIRPYSHQRSRNYPDRSILPRPLRGFQFARAEGCPYFRLRVEAEGIEMIGRRSVLLAALAGVASPKARAADEAAEVTRAHGLSMLGTPQLPPDFPYFPYVNPDAPKGGEVVLSSV